MVMFVIFHVRGLNERTWFQGKGFTKENKRDHIRKCLKWPLFYELGVVGMGVLEHINKNSLVLCDSIIPWPDYENKIFVIRFLYSTTIGIVVLLEYKYMHKNQYNLSCKALKQLWWRENNFVLTVHFRKIWVV